MQTSQKVTVHVNNDQSRNCCSSRGMNVFAVEVPARTKMVRSLPGNAVRVIMTRKKILNLTLKIFHSTAFKCTIKLFTLNKKIIFYNWYDCTMVWNDYMVFWILIQRCMSSLLGVPTHPPHQWETGLDLQLCGDHTTLHIKLYCYQEFIACLCYWYRKVTKSIHKRVV